MNLPLSIPPRNEAHRLRELTEKAIAKQKQKDLESVDKIFQACLAGALSRASKGFLYTAFNSKFSDLPNSKDAFDLLVQRLKNEGFIVEYEFHDDEGRKFCSGHSLKLSW